jgi:hypothetical protein
METMFFTIENNSRKRLVWSLNAEAWTGSVRMDVLRAAVGHNSLLLHFIAWDK